jgi:tetratricopeptide (TPR) repeat protein
MSIKELIKQADEAYYQARYEIAIELYQKVLEASPKNKHAKEQLKKAEFKLSSKSPFPNVPPEAQELYRRSRSFIRAGDMRQAKKLLNEAIVAAKKNKVNFIQAQQLLDNLPDAQTAEGYKKKALEQLDNKLWPGALENLKTAVDLDPTDENAQTLLSHLEGLIQAQSQVSRLQAGIKNRNEYQTAVNEVQKITEMTKKSAGLSVLWQEVVREFGKIDEEKKLRENRTKLALWSAIGAILLTIGMFYLLYLFPRAHPVANCSVETNLETILNVPVHIANGDNNSITLTIKNIGDEVINGQVLINFRGTPTVRIDTEDGSKILLEKMNPGEQRSFTIGITPDGPFKILTDPSYRIEFDLVIQSNASICTSQEFYIALAPIYGLSKLVGALWALFGVSLIGLFKDRIFKFLGVS